MHSAISSASSIRVSKAAFVPPKCLNLSPIFTLYNIHYTMYSLNVLISPHLYNVQYAMYNVLISTSFRNIQYTMHNIRCIMSISQSLQYTIYNVQYMIYTIYNVYVSISQSLRCTIDFMVIHKTQCINLLAY